MARPNTACPEIKPRERLHPTDGYVGVSDHLRGGCSCVQPAPLKMPFYLSVLGCPEGKHDLAAASGASERGEEDRYLDARGDAAGKEPAVGLWCGQNQPALVVAEEFHLGMEMEAYCDIVSIGLRRRLLD